MRKFAILALVTVSCSILFSHSANAANLSQFNAGRIIDDGVMTNTSTMGVQQIQDFLNSKLSSCDTSGALNTTYYYDAASGMYGSRFTSTTVTTSRAVQGQRYDTFWRTHPDLKNQYNPNWHEGDAAAPYTCLKDYRVGDGRTAAQVIYDTAQKWHINPQVFIVLLQKENSLITDDYPWPLQMRTATGYGCPDNNVCDSQYFGLLNQLDWSGRLFRRVIDRDPNWYSPYTTGTNYIQWSPNASCGGSNVNVQNWSTASLYDYTPYQPNAAALAAGSGAGDGCSAYGNRNFYIYFNDWFGSTLAPSYSWQLQSQYAFTDSSKTTPTGLGNLIPGQRVFIGFTALNTGSTTWTNSGANPIRVGTLREAGRPSAFYDPTWLGYGRPAAMKEASVAPGQVGTFEFWITAPASSVGNFNEYFGLLSEGASWMPDIGMFYGISVQPARYTWQLTSQYAFTDDTKTVGTGLGGLEPGQRRYVGFTAKNTGNITWTNSGANPMNLGTSHGLGRASAFYDPTWLGYGRPARMKEASVAPGQTATFEFWITAPMNSYGSFTEYFDPVIEGRAWLDDIGFNYAASVISPNYAWQLTGQYAFTDATKTTGMGLGNLSPGQTAFIGLTAKNTGNITWYNTGNNPVDLGTSNPYDRSSALCAAGTGWLGCNRPARMKEASVAPGQTATFEFLMKAPQTPGTYREYFNPVVEGRAWMPNIGLNYLITVH